MPLEARNAKQFRVHRSFIDLLVQTDCSSAETTRARVWAESVTFFFQKFQPSELHARTAPFYLSGTASDAVRRQSPRIADAPACQASEDSAACTLRCAALRCTFGSAFLSLALTFANQAHASGSNANKAASVRVLICCCCSRRSLLNLVDRFACPLVFSSSRIIRCRQRHTAHRYR